MNVSVETTKNSYELRVIQIFQKYRSHPKIPGHGDPEPENGAPLV
jgi:hypothetical protein